MGTNRAHHSPNTVNFINSILIGSPKDALFLLLFSINAFLNNEIEATISKNPPQSSLLFMGIHAGAITIAEVFFNKSGYKGYKKFLEEFIDGDTEDRKFSAIAPQIHAWRNTLAHGWLSLKGHNTEYDYKMRKGFEFRGKDLYINPKIYLDLYLKAFDMNGRLLNYLEQMKKEDLINGQKILIKKYLK